MSNNELKEISTKDLVLRMGGINRTIDELTMEYNAIVHELWDRIPPLKEDTNMQEKEKRLIR